LKTERKDSNEKITKTLSFIMAVMIVLSVSALSVTAAAISSDVEETAKGNVPVTYIPGSEITFGADGDFEITHIADPAPISQNVGQEIGGNLLDENPEFYKSFNKAMHERFENLPVYEYEDYYIAHEGAVALYDDAGDFIRVRGDYEYHSTLDEYRIDGSLPDGRYVGTYSEFSQISNLSVNGRTVSKSESGKFTTFGDYWPVIDSSRWPNCNTDPVPNGPTYGDRIGTQNNKLYVGDVALKKESGVPYDSKITVTVQAADTAGSGVITKEMRVRDTMSSRADSVLDIWRWDSPEWFEGTPQRPNDIYFGQTYATWRSFTNKDNFWTYSET